GPTQRDGVCGGSPCGETGQAFVVGKGGDAKAIGCLDALLGSRKAQSPHGWIHGSGAKWARELADAVGHEAFEVCRRVLQVLVRRYWLPGIGRPNPDAHELPYLFGESHLPY